MPDAAPLPAFRPVDLAEPTVEVERRADGVIVLRSGYPLQAYPDHILCHLEHWAAAAPTLDRRAAEVVRLYAEPAPAGVIAA